MSDSWARPTGADPPTPTAGEVIEIDLVGSPDADERGDGTAREPTPTNWRKVVALSSIAGVVLGAIVAAVMITSDDGAPPSPTTLPREELAALITTPPTLPPVVSEVPDDPRPLVVQAPEFSLPRYPATFTGAGSAFDASTFTGPDLDAPRVATIIATSSASSTSTESRVAYDQTNERFELTVDLPVGSARTIYDARTGTIYEQRPSTDPDDVWRSRDGSAALARITRTLGISVDDYFRQLVLGPVRADNLDEAITISTDDFSYEVLGQTTHRLVVRLPVRTIGLWQPGGAEDPEAIVTYEVYVDDDGEVVLTQGLVSGADAVRGLQHSMAFPETGTIIELPDADTVVDDAAPALPAPPAGDGTAESLRPTYPAPTDLSAVDQEQFDVELAFDTLLSLPPAASTVDVIWSDGRSRFVAQRDDPNDRRSVMITSTTSDGTTIQIDDGASATTLLTDDQSRVWTRLSSTGLGGRRLPVDERLISGPITGGTIDAAELEPGQLVVLDDGTIARQVRLVVRPGALALPSIVPMQLDPERPVDAYVYVGAGVVHEIQVVSNVDARVYVQTFDVRARPEIGLPDPSIITDG
jgi:hypothetical protein